MATYPKRPPKVVGDNSFISYAVEYLPEGGSQTFKAGAPVVLASGLIIEATSPISTSAKVFGIAMEDGHNKTADTVRVKVLPLKPHSGPPIDLFANFLATSAADNAFAAADVGTKFDFVKSSGGLWYIQDSTSQAIAQVIARRTDIILPNLDENTHVAVGDINVRVPFHFLETVLQIGA